MNLKEFFNMHNKIALAFSGGVDSSYLLYYAVTSNINIKAYFVKTAFTPDFEINDAKLLAKQLNANLQIIELDIMQNSNILSNPANRCYYCKQEIFSAILKQAKSDGYSKVMDGSNASDDEHDRPGFKALKELEVLSPLRDCGLTKSDIRKLSKDATLFTWSKPAYACLATRIPTGVLIDSEKLNKTQKAEDFLMSMGFSDFRIRYFSNCAKIQLCKNQFSKLLENRALIYSELKKLYDDVLLDMEARDE